MSLTLSNASEADLVEYSRIHAAAFGTQLYRLLYTGPLSDTSLAALTRQISTARAANPNYHVLKVTDDATGETLAFAKWIMHPTERTQEQLDEDLRWFPEILPESNADAVRELITSLHEVCAETLGRRPYCALGALITDPKHQRRGAGSMLLNWGTQIADAAGLECYLEATETGRPLYERHGFEAVKEIPLQPEKYGVYGFGKLVAMLRPARLAN